MSAPDAPAVVPATELKNQTQIQISVQGRTLSVYPQRAHDVAIYHVTEERRSEASPSKPHKVRWVVDGLRENQELAIETNPNQAFRLERGETSRDLPTGLLEMMRCKGPGAHTEVSGLPSHPGPGHGLEQSWKYDIVLYEDGREVTRLDPVVIIKEDP
jgi:hypothetical protein